MGLYSLKYLMRKKAARVGRLVLYRYSCILLPVEYLFSDFLKISFGMFTDRTYEIIRQFLSFILIAAYRASPYGLAFGSRSNILWFWFDVVLIVLICARGDI